MNLNKHEQKLEDLKTNKEEIYMEMSKQSSEPSVIDYYEKQGEEYDGIDIEIIDGIYENKKY